MTVDLKFDARLEIVCSIQVSLHREIPDVCLVEKSSGKFLLVGGTVCTIPT